MASPSSSSSSVPALSQAEARVTVLISGSGSNLQALIDATTAGSSSVERLPNARITHVISNRSAAFGLQRCARADPPIPTDVLALKTYQTRNPGATREDYDEALAKLVRSHKPDLVVLAGFMHILSPTFLAAIPAGLPIINLHPALPGQFDGAAAIPRALAAFEKGEVKNTGVMVHRVVAEVDRGEPVCVREVEIKSGDSLEDLEQRIHAVEHTIIIQGARKVLDEWRADTSAKAKEADAPPSKAASAKGGDEAKVTGAKETADGGKDQATPVEDALKGLKL